MNPKIRWGILSTGSIADSFVRGLRFCPDAEVAAVGSRTSAAAERFGARLGIPRRHGSYEALAADPDVDIVYIGTPHNLHCQNTLMCLAAGKAVLCEKPFALNADQAGRMINAARSRRLFGRATSTTHAIRSCAARLSQPPARWQAGRGCATRL